MQADHAGRRNCHGGGSLPRVRPCCLSPFVTVCAHGSMLTLPTCTSAKVRSHVIQHKHDRNATTVCDLCRDSLVLYPNRTGPKSDVAHRRLYKRAVPPTATRELLSWEQPQAKQPGPSDYARSHQSSMLSDKSRRSRMTVPPEQWDLHLRMLDSSYSAQAAVHQKQRVMRIGSHSERQKHHAI